MDFKNASLQEVDPELADLVEHEKHRQVTGLELIASENFTSQAVMECLGSCLTNKYSEGMPGKRYYGGNEFIDQVENLCMARALKAYRLDPEEWGVNVQPYSGSPANFAVYTALLDPHDRIMGLGLPSGGHLTHGYYTAKKKISATSIYFESLPYEVESSTGLIDYEQMAARAKMFRPKMLIAGASAYPRDWDYKRIRAIADEVGAMLMMDMSHISGLVATQTQNNPFEYCHIVTTTTHKSLRGPRSGMIFYRKDKELNFEARINFAVFPSLQGGPHNHQIAGVCCQLREVDSPGFVEYSKQVISNCQAMAKGLMDKGYKLCTDGTDNHLILWDLRPMGLTGSKVEYLCDQVSITLNKNSVHGDKSAFSPGGVRIGSPALTSRGLKEKEMGQVADFLHRAVQICVKVMGDHGKAMTAFRKGVASGAYPEIKQLKKDVNDFMSSFFMPGIDKNSMKYKVTE